MSRFTHQQRLGSRMLIALFDAGLVMVAVCCALLWQAGSLDHLVPVAGTHGVSLGAGLFFINAANGFYDSSQRPPVLQLLLRTALALGLALGLSVSSGGGSCVFFFLQPATAKAAAATIEAVSNARFRIIVSSTERATCPCGRSSQGS